MRDTKEYLLSNAAAVTVAVPDTNVELRRSGVGPIINLAPHTPISPKLTQENMEPCR